MEILKTSLDTLDIAFKGRINQDLIKILSAAKEETLENNVEKTLATYRGETFHVHNVARKGFSFMCSTGDFGALFWFKKSQNIEGWNIFVSVRSACLAIGGFAHAKDHVLGFLHAIGAKVIAESINRFDYAIDIIAPEFNLNPDHIVACARSKLRPIGANLEDLSRDQTGRSGRWESCTIGKQPNAQVIIYDKRRQVLDKRLLYWYQIWNNLRREEGKSPVTKEDRIWRIEARAGKKYLSETCQIKTFDQFETSFRSIVHGLLKRITLRSATDDSNRSRWPIHPIWQLAQKHVLNIPDYHGDLSQDFSRVRKVKRDQQRTILAEQVRGLVAAITVCEGRKPHEAFIGLMKQVAHDFDRNWEEFLNAIKRAGKKYFFLQENISAKEYFKNAIGTNHEDYSLEKGGSEFARHVGLSLGFKSATSLCPN